VWNGLLWLRIGGQLWVSVDGVKQKSCDFCTICATTSFSKPLLIQVRFQITTLRNMQQGTGRPAPPYSAQQVTQHNSDESHAHREILLLEVNIVNVVMTKEWGRCVPNELKGTLRRRSRHVTSRDVSAQRVY